MDYIFEVVDKTGRKIHLSKGRWSHIQIEHPQINDIEEIKETLLKPMKILESDRDENVRWYFVYKKHKKRYLKISVKYLNGEGYIITAHFTSKIQ